MRILNAPVKSLHAAANNIEYTTGVTSDEENPDPYADGSMYKDFSGVFEMVAKSFLLTEK
jgi:hypothetical protein